MLRGVHTKINFSLNLSRVDLKVAPDKKERIACHLQFFPIFFDHPLFFNRFLKKPELCRRMVQGHFNSRRGSLEFRLFQNWWFWWFWISIKFCTRWLIHNRVSKLSVFPYCIANNRTWKWSTILNIFLSSGEWKECDFLGAVYWPLE